MGNTRQKGDGSLGRSSIYLLCVSEKNCIELKHLDCNISLTDRMELFKLGYFILYFVFYSFFKLN